MENDSKGVTKESYYGQNEGKYAEYKKDSEINQKVTHGI